MASQLQSEIKKAVDDKKLPAVGAIALDSSGKEIFNFAYGTNNINESSSLKFTNDTCLLLFSCTKLVTSIAALQLIEQGKLRLDDLVEKYVPSIKDAQVLEGFDADGQPKLRDAVGKATVLNLFTHTAGFSYDFFDKDCLKWRLAVGQSPAGYVAVSALTDYKTPLKFDPSGGYSYGVNTDYLGWVVESISGLGLAEYCEKHILGPLGLKNTGLQPPTAKDEFLAVHFKGEDGKLTPNPAVVFPPSAEVVAGGHFLTSTLADYSQFLLTLLNNGTHPKTGVKILEEKTAKEFLFRDFMPEICTAKDIGIIGSSIDTLSNEGEFMPGIPKGWSCGLMMNNEDTPNGRKKGSGAWAGLGNLYYWIDPQAGKLGMIGTAVLPFLDPELMHLSDGLERLVYGRDPAKERGEKGSNYVITRAIDVGA